MALDIAAKVFKETHVGDNSCGEKARFSSPLCLKCDYCDRMGHFIYTLLPQGQVALEGNFRFVLDKSDLKSASDKKFVRKATVALKNKICEQNTTPCCERLVILGFLTDHAFQPTVKLKASPLLHYICPEPSCSRLTKMHGAKKMGLMPALSYLR